MDTNSPAQPAPKSGVVIAALICGIIALLTSFLPIINNLSFFLAIIGLILAIVGILGIRKGTKSGMGLAVASVVICIVAGAIVFASQAMMSAAIDEASKSLDKAAGNATEEVLANEFDVALGSYSIEKDGYGLIESSLPVTVTNLTNNNTSGSIQIEAVDASGNRIANDYINVNNLGAGQSQTFEAFQYVPSNDYEAMQGAAFNVVEASAF